MERVVVALQKSGFTKMPWKNGRGVTAQIYIHPGGSSVEKNDFVYRLSSAPIEQDGPFSQFPGKQRILVPLKGAGFTLNQDIYEKFEMAYFSGDEKIQCSLLKGPVLDFGIIYDSEKVRVNAKILLLKTESFFSLDKNSDYFVTVLDGKLTYEGKELTELDTLHYRQEDGCRLQAVKSAVLIFLSISRL